MSAGPSSAEQALHAAIAQHLLPADAVLPPQDRRPWPVMLLTALGAWLAAIPLLGVVGLLLGDVISKSIGPYIVGTLVLAAAVTVLRSRALPVFLEQLAVPGLLVGGGALGFGLFRDLPAQAADSALMVLALALAAAIPRPWLRTLLGAAAASLCIAMLLPRGLFRTADSPQLSAWLALHATLLLWLGALALQRRSGASLAALIESAAAGWLLPVLAGLCAWSGMTFMLAGTLGDGMWGEAAGQAGRRTDGNAFVLLQAGSVALTFVAAAVCAKHWTWLRQPLAAPVALVLAALGWFLPALGGVLLALVWTGTSQRWRQAGAAALATAWIVGSFYYQLQWPLGQKAVVLVAAGAILGALAWAARRPRLPSTAVALRNPMTRAACLVAFAGLATLLAVNLSIRQKESLIARGDKVFVALAPVDPRSLMQGDFMRLNYSLPAAVEDGLRSLATLERPQVIARRDARGVAQLLRIASTDTVPGPGEMRIELTPKDGRWILVSDAWFFREGDGQRWQAAKFGEFRVLTDGRALLVGLADERLQTIPVRP